MILNKIQILKKWRTVNEENYALLSVKIRIIRVVPRAIVF